MVRAPKRVPLQPRIETKRLDCGLDCSATFILSALFLHQDGDFSTSWTCTGDPTEPNDEGITSYQCELLFSVVYFRRIKQVKIGENLIRLADLMGRVSYDPVRQTVCSRPCAVQPKGDVCTQMRMAMFSSGFQL